MPQTMPEATPGAPTGCLVAQFKALSLKQNDVVLRAHQAKTWLRRNVAKCTAEQLSAIMGNSPTWLGTALTQDIASFIEGAVEIKALGQPEQMARLYESLGKEGAKEVVTIDSGKPRPPVVPSMVVGDKAMKDSEANAQGKPAAEAPIAQNSAAVPADMAKTVPPKVMDKVADSVAQKMATKVKTP